MAGRPKKGTATEFDFSNTEAIEREFPKVLTTSKYDNTPFPGWYEESWTSGLAKSILIPAAAVPAAKAAVRRAAEVASVKWEVKAGSRFNVTETENGMVNFTFLAVDRTKVPDETGEETAE